MLENQSLWNAARRCHETLQRAEIPHLIVGGVAVCLHGYRRNTIDVDFLVRSQDSERLKASIKEADFVWDGETHEFRNSEGVQIQLLISGDRAGTGSQVTLPDPSNEKVVALIEGFPVVSLASLIEIKIACGERSVRRTHRDFADVVELIAVHKLDGPFAQNLHQSVRATFRKLAKNAAAK